MTDQYGNLASIATVATQVNPGDATASLSTFTGYPAPPFWAEFEKGTASAEIVKVTSVAGSVVTITRAQGGTTATTHGAGVSFEHVAPAVFFNDSVAHAASTTVHGVTGNVVGTAGAQAIQDKTYRGAFRAVFSDALPAATTISYESDADTNGARDGFVSKNTAGDPDRRAFLAQQNGVDRYQVFNDGTVDINPSTSTRPALRNHGSTVLDGTLAVAGALTASNGAAITGATTVGGNTAVTGSLSASGLLSAGAGAAVTGNVSATGDVSAAGNSLIGGNQSVTGTSTVTGAAIVGSLTTAGGVTATGAVSGSTGTFSSAVKSYGLTIPVVATVNALADVVTPVTDQVVILKTDLNLYHWDGTGWRNTSTQTFDVQCSASLAIGTADGDITGCTVTFTTFRANAKLVVVGYFDFELVTTGTGFCYGQAALDGTAMNGGRAAIFNLAAGERVSGAKTWSAAIATPGSHTVKLIGHKDVAAGSAFFRSGHTVLQATLFDK